MALFEKREEVFCKRDREGWTAAKAALKAAGVRGMRAWTSVILGRRGESTGRCMLSQFPQQSWRGRRQRWRAWRRGFEHGISLFALICT